MYDLIVLASVANMASGYTPKSSKGGKCKRSRKAKKDESCDLLCNICDTNFRKFDADVYCTDCNDYFCSRCLRDSHKVGGPNADHILVKRDDMIVGGNSSHGLTEPCEVHVKLLVDMYCEAHNSVACSMCMKQKHKLVTANINWKHVITKRRAKFEK